MLDYGVRSNANTKTQIATSFANYQRIITEYPIIAHMHYPTHEVYCRLCGCEIVTTIWCEPCKLMLERTSILAQKYMPELHRAEHC